MLAPVCERSNARSYLAGYTQHRGEVSAAQIETKSAPVVSDIMDSALWMALDDGQVCRGIITINESQEAEYQTVEWQYQREKILVVHRLAVNPNSQGQGIASLLMDFAEDRARVEGYHAIRLDAFAQNAAALRLYMKRRYRLAGHVRFRKGTFDCVEKSVLPT